LTGKTDVTTQNLCRNAGQPVAAAFPADAGASSFGLVGGSGTVINIVVLYLAQEHFLNSFDDFHMATLIALAITVATVSNFYWNRRLTWRDRTRNTSSRHLRLFAST
jgi:putative flippase GtrA